jgi:hypothetical protein
MHCKERGNNFRTFETHTHTHTHRHMAGSVVMDVKSQSFLISPQCLVCKVSLQFSPDASDFSAGVPQLVCVFLYLKSGARNAGICNIFINNF